MLLDTCTFVCSITDLVLLWPGGVLVLSWSSLFLRFHYTQNMDSWTFNITSSTLIFVSCLYSSLVAFFMLSSPFILCFQQVVDKNNSYNPPIVMCAWTCLFILQKFLRFKCHTAITKRHSCQANDFRGRIIFLKQLTNVCCPDNWIHGKRKGAYIILVHGEVGREFSIQNRTVVIHDLSIYL